MYLINLKCQPLLHCTLSQVVVGEERIFPSVAQVSANKMLDPFYHPTPIAWPKKYFNLLRSQEKQEAHLEECRAILTHKRIAFWFVLIVQGV